MNEKKALVVVVQRPIDEQANDYYAVLLKPAFIYEGQHYLDQVDDLIEKGFTVASSRDHSECLVTKGLFALDDLEDKLGLKSELESGLPVIADLSGELPQPLADEVTGITVTVYQSGYAEVEAYTMDDTPFTSEGFSYEDLEKLERQLKKQQEKE